MESEIPAHVCVIQDFGSHDLVMLKKDGRLGKITLERRSNDAEK